MKRRIVKIDESKCNGCGACAKACHEGAIGMVDGKAKLLRDDYCDGLGDCLPACPADAISFEEREALPYDEEAVLKAKAEKEKMAIPKAGGCPGTKIREMKRNFEESLEQGIEMPSMLQNWPVQIKLAPIHAPYFDEANLLIAADCSAYAYAAFHRDFVKGRVTLIGCPKLDAIDYSEKLTEILKNNAIESVTVVRMEVPCCGGLEAAVKKAIDASKKAVPCQVVTIGIDGKLL